MAGASRTGDVPGDFRANGTFDADAGGRAVGRRTTSHEVASCPIGDTPGYQLAVEWPEAQEYRKKLGLGPKDLHVSLNGGIGDAISKREAARAEARDDEGSQR